MCPAALFFPVPHSLDDEEYQVLDIARRVHAAIFATIVLSPAVLSGQQIDVRLGNTPTVVVNPNGKLTVPVIVDIANAGSANIASIVSGMTWGASRLTLDSVRIVAAAWTLSGGVPASGSTSFGASSAFALAATGTLANAYFTAGSTPGGTRVSLAPTAAANLAGGSVLSLLRPRQLDACIANSGKGGDVTNDNAVSIIDGQQLARYAVGLVTMDPVSIAARGDVDANASINIIDAQQIARYAVGLPVTPSAQSRINNELFTPPSVASVSLSPASAQFVAVGNTLQVVATPQAGSTDLSGCAPINWSSSNTSVATVSASGLVTAIASGTATITATSATTPAANATISITVPSAATVLLSEDFESANLGARGWYDNTTAVLSTAEKFSGNSSAEFRFLAGATLPTSGASMRRKFTPTSSLYISYNVKFTSNWVGSQQAYHPHEFYAMTTMDANDWVGPANSWLTVYLEHNYQNGLKPVMGLQDNQAINTTLGTPSINLDLTRLTENRSVSGCNGMLETGMLRECFAVAGETPPWYNSKKLIGPVAMQPTPGPNYKGNWNFVEAYFQMNTIVGGIGQPNGILQYWLNGTLLMSRTDVVFRTGTRATMLFNKILIAPYIGDGSPVDQSMFIDNLVVKTGR